MKSSAKHFFADRDIQLILGTLLRVGVILAVSFLFMGAVIYLWYAGDAVANYVVFDPRHVRYKSIAAIVEGLSQFDGTAIIQFGVVLLIFTPVLRVAFSIFSFVIARDYLYVGIGLLVLFIILFSLSNTFVH